MKRFVSTALLLIFLFNVGGYYFLLLGLRYSAYQEITHRMESKSQSTQDTYEFKIPLALPYPIQENYVRNFGEFEYNGEHYIFAGQRLSDDTLYIKTVRNIKKKELYKAFEEYAKMSNDMPSSKQKQGRGLLAKIIKEYKSGHACEIVRQTDLLRQIDLFVAFDGKLCEEYVATAFHPPRNFS